MLLELGTGHRVSFRRIGSDDQDTIGMFQVFDGIGSSTGTEGALHAQGGGRVADPGAAVDVVGAHYGPHEFLHQVIFFIGTTR